MILTAEDRRILDAPYRKEETTRADIEFYMKYQSRGGDFRLSAGLIRTEQEQRDFIERSLTVKLPKPLQK